MNRYAIEDWKRLSSGFNPAWYRIEGEKKYDNTKASFWIDVVGTRSYPFDFDDLEFAMRIWASFKDTNPTCEQLGYFVGFGYKKLHPQVSELSWETLLKSNPAMETMKRIADGEPQGAHRLAKAMDWILDRDQDYHTLGFIKYNLYGTWGDGVYGTEAEIAAIKQRLTKLWDEKYPNTLRITRRVRVTPIWNFKEALERGNYTRGDLESGHNDSLREWFVQGRRFREHCYYHYPLRDCAEAGSEKAAEIYVLEQVRHPQRQHEKEPSDSILRYEMDKMCLRPAPLGYLLGYAVKNWDPKVEQTVFAMGTRCWNEDDEYPCGRRPFFLTLHKWMTSPGSADECRKGTHIPKELRALCGEHPDIWVNGGLGDFHLALRKDAKIKGKPLPEEKDPNPPQEENRVIYTSTEGGISRNWYNLNPAIFTGIPRY